MNNCVQDIKGRSGKMPAVNDAGDGLRFELNYGMAVIIEGR